MGREQILRRFEQWLDDALAAADPPAGIDAELLAALASDEVEEHAGPDRRCDFHALWAALTALTQEVKLEGRAFKDLNETLATQAPRIAEEVRAAYRERERDLQREAERKSRREILAALIDLRDRLSRGLESARASEPGFLKPASWPARFVFRSHNKAAAETLAALTKGYELGIERLDQTLEEFNAREVRCIGQAFDPARMNAIDKVESSAVPEGTVIEVYRSGYEWNGEVFRPAQVKVSRAPANQANE